MAWERAKGTTISDTILKRRPNFERPSEKWLALIKGVVSRRMASGYRWVGLARAFRTGSRS